MDPRERWSDHEESLRTALDGRLSEVWTGMPATIISCNGHTATVQPSVQRTKLNPDGSTSILTLPPISDVIVQFPSGGGATLTFPVKQGDECWLSFSSRSIDGWFQYGGEQLPPHARTHSLSDAVAHLGFRSQPRKLAGVSSTTTQLRSDDGATYVEVDPAGKVNMVFPAGATFTGNVAIVGMLTVTGLIVAGFGTADPVTVTTHNHTNGNGGAPTGPPIPGS